MSHGNHFPPYDISRDVRNLKKSVERLARDAHVSEWYDYTPTWTAVTTNPVINNGVLTSRYQRSGYLVEFKLYLKIGSTTTLGSGLWSFTLPFSVVPYTGGTDAGTMTSMCLDSSAGLMYPGSAYLTSDSQIWRVVSGQGTAGVSSTSPFTWNTSDVLMINGFFETDQ